MDNTLNNISNKFTGKERDQETGYDYFGARYYDSRIGRWLSMDLLMDKYIFISPYSYTLNNPLILTDPTGLWIPEYNSETKTIRVRAEKDDNLQDLYLQLGLTKEEFAQKYSINNINDFNVNEGETNFDITEFVTPNTDYDPYNKSSNCHGWILFTREDNVLSPKEESSVSFEDMNNKLRDMTNKLKTGNIAVFEFKDVDVGVQAKIGYPGHTALFVIKDSQGKMLYLNRLNFGLPVTLNTLEEINEYNRKISEIYYNDFKKIVKLSESPIYYERIK